MERPGDRRGEALRSTVEHLGRGCTQYVQLYGRLMLSSAQRKLAARINLRILRVKFTLDLIFVMNISIDFIDPIWESRIQTQQAFRPATRPNGKIFQLESHDHNPAVTEGKSDKRM